MGASGMPSAFIAGSEVLIDGMAVAQKIAFR
jgi:hypothetical protein